MTRIVLKLVFAAALLGAASPSFAAPAIFPFAEAVRAGDTLYLSGQIGVPPGTATLAPGGITAEARQAMENIGAVLRRHRLGYADLVKCTAMLTDMRQWGEFNRIYAAYFPDGRYPARSALGASALALGASIEIECIARFPARAEGINPGAPLGPYSQAVRVGGTLYVSGVVAFDARKGAFAEPAIEAQMRQVLANLDAILTVAGVDRRDVVKTVMYLRDPKDVPAANAAYAAYFKGDPKPARTTVPGADWGRPDILVEIEATAIARERPEGDAR